MGIEEFNDRLIYCNPYTNPFGWASHFWGDYTPNKYDSPFIKLYEYNKKRDNDDLKKLFPMLDLTTKAATGIGGRVVNENPSKLVAAALGPVPSATVKAATGIGERAVEEPSNLIRAALGPILGGLVKDSKTGKIPDNLTTEQRKDYIQAHGGGLRFPEKKVDNSAAIVAGGCTILTGLAIAADCVFAKGKHVKQLAKVFKKAPKSRPASVKSAKLPKNASKTHVQGRQFASIREAESHFRNMGIETDFSRCTDLRQLSQIDTELAKIRALGIESQVKSITVTPFDRQSMLNATRARGIECPIEDISWARGLSDEGHIFLNSNGFNRMANGSDVIKHEIGHYFRNENCQHLNNMLEKAAQKNNLSKQQLLDRLTSRLHSEVKAYSPMADENFADMFSLMIDGRQYSKGAMLFYDMAGGARIPNKVINGMKYDDYISKLYENAENILMNYIK